ncbi:MAG: DUF1549 and DUF1553 domain-containing protein, partial [Pirellula sp.]
PRDDATSTDKSGMPKETESIDWEQARRFWSFRPVQKRIVPKIDGEYGNTSIDAFIAAKHRENGLLPKGQVDRTTWLRRVYIDLVGIPPTIDAIDAFQKDLSPDCFERTVDELIASTEYGIRWGRYWLDLARYADSNGADENHRYPVAWRYRDYVIDAFNQDVPYDRFVLEQLAGDLLVSQDEAETRRQITATGFLVIGPKMLAEQDKPKLVADFVDEQIDTIGKSLLGLTLGCARCHDHKFDPILASDYYSLAGILHSTKTMEHVKFVSQWNERILPNAAESQKIAAYEQKLSIVRNEFVELERNFRSRAVSGQLHPLLAAMHWQVGQTAQSTIAPDLIPASLSPWISILEKKDNNKNDVFYVWRNLYETPDNKFGEASKKLWQDLSSFDSKPSDWNTRLRDVSPPNSKLELIQLYGTLLARALKQLGESPRNADGKFESADMQRLYSQLVSKSEYFSAFDKYADSMTDSEKASYSERKVAFEKMDKAKPVASKAMAVVDEPEVKLVAINVRGNHLQTKGAPLSRNVPRVLRAEFDSGALDIPDKTSGRLQLAQWIIDERNPLTARVIVNRIWQGHFGVGIVPSSSNFGFRGEQPTNPELLDWLSDAFIQNGWSIKWLHRQIVLSSTYRLSSSRDAEMEHKDPSNRWLWRQNKKRMEAEVLRDSLLSIGEVLDSSMGGEAQNINASNHPSLPSSQSLGNTRHTTFIEVNRAALNDFLATFDYVEPGVSVERRSNTIVPHQALFLMNHPLPMEIGKRIATRIVAESKSDEERLMMATKIILGRSPTANELATLAQYILRSANQDPLALGSATQPNSPSNQEGAASTELISLSELNSPLEKWIQICRSLLLTNEFLYVE